MVFEGLLPYSLLNTVNMIKNIYFTLYFFTYPTSSQQHSCMLECSSISNSFTQISSGSKMDEAFTAVVQYHRRAHLCNSRGAVHSTHRRSVEVSWRYGCDWGWWTIAVSFLFFWGWTDLGSQIRNDCIQTDLDMEKIEFVMIRIQTDLRKIKEQDDEDGYEMREYHERIIMESRVECHERNREDFLHVCSLCTAHFFTGTAYGYPTVGRMSLGPAVERLLCSPTVLYKYVHTVRRPYCTYCT